jgi:hypothetical protein
MSKKIRLGILGGGGDSLIGVSSQGRFKHV